MILNNLKRQNRRFYEFFGDFGLRDTFQKRIAPKSIEIGMEKLHRKFSALNVDFDGLSFDFLGSRKPAHESRRERFPVKVVILPLLASLLLKRLQISMACCLTQQALVTSFFSRINISDFERPWTSKIRGFIDFCNLRLQRTLQEWTATEIDWQFSNRSCYRPRLSLVSWALAQISCKS